VEEAVGLVLEAARMASGGEVFVLDMGEEVRILDLVRAFARAMNVPEPEIRFTGLQAGEKMRETLFSAHEAHARTGHPRILAATASSRPAVAAALRPLDELYEAADRNDRADTRRLLARMLPGFPAQLREEETAHAVRR